MTALQTHLDDGQLLEAVDSSAPSAVNAHLRECESCSSRLRELQQAGARASAAIERLPVSSLDPRLRTRILARRDRRPSAFIGLPMLAAATILLVASAALASPVRHWITRKLGVSSAPPAIQVPGPDNIGPRPAPVPAMSVSFAVTDSVLNVRILRNQAVGGLALTHSESGAVVAQVVANGADEEFLVTPGGLTIRNTDSSRAGYRVAIPDRVHVVRLDIAGRRRTFFTSSLPRELIPLSRPR
jgi:hypothetical protein